MSNNEDPLGTRVAQKRLNPLEMLALRKAVLAKRKTFVMRSKTFNITYEPGGTVWYYPATGGFAPCGRIRVSRLKKYVEEMNTE